MFHPHICQEITKWLDYQDQENLSLVNRYYHQVLLNQEGYKTYQVVKRALKQKDIEKAITVATPNPSPTLLGQNKQKIAEYIMSEMEKIPECGSKQYERLARSFGTEMNKYFGGNLDFVSSKLKEVGILSTVQSKTDTNISFLIYLIGGYIAINNELWKKYYDELDNLSIEMALTFFKSTMDDVYSLTLYYRSIFITIAILSKNEAAFHHIYETIEPSGLNWINETVLDVIGKNEDEETVRYVEGLLTCK